LQKQVVAVKNSVIGTKRNTMRRLIRRKFISCEKEGWGLQSDEQKRISKKDTEKEKLEPKKHSP
jgi:hypothetical protein